nr:hypothetical protein [uncultured Rhodoferax sp.]
MENQSKHPNLDDSMPQTIEQTHLKPYKKPQFTVLSIDQKTSGAKAGNPTETGIPGTSVGPS